MFVDWTVRMEMLHFLCVCMTVNMPRHSLSITLFLFVSWDKVHVSPMLAPNSLPFSLSIVNRVVLFADKFCVLCEGFLACDVKIYQTSWVWWCSNITSALRREQQHWEFKISWKFIVKPFSNVSLSFQQKNKIRNSKFGLDYPFLNS